MFDHLFVFLLCAWVVYLFVVVLFSFSSVFLSGKEEGEAVNCNISQLDFAVCSSYVFPGIGA